ncbi:DUF1836 domain-containing protein [Paenibacillus sp. MER TA 81-3]|uniref:DUF1836 domain-containing protein n=1 Tax=Paenibacillus sp. MER TA 81-3 TaxID=2939573 RepID=UPI00203CDAB6|nr:DUF1836 domain-containing protein [Paenibacillus sp. MER TA 81-3]MCM3340361.1 DUF1836 domain-containing protein [Paenibacillus sp. MER TA 81-3]
MDSFVITRKKMSELLMALQPADNTAREQSPAPQAILQKAWEEFQQQLSGLDITASPMLSATLPPIYEKLLRGRSHKEGLSLNEIAALGNQVEYSNFSITSIQNWVKRDIKDFIGSPRLGKKYSLQQAALILIVEDLRATLHFDSIRSLLALLFMNPEQDEDDVIHPLNFYAAYATLYEELDQNNDQVLDVHGHDPLRLRHDHMLELIISNKTDDHMSKLAPQSHCHRTLIRNALVIAITSVQTTYFQYLAKKYMNATLLSGQTSRKNE